MSDKERISRAGLLRRKGDAIGIFMVTIWLSIFGIFICLWSIIALDHYTDVFKTESEKAYIKLEETYFKCKRTYGPFHGDPSASLAPWTPVCKEVRELYMEKREKESEEHARETLEIIRNREQ